MKKILLLAAALLPMMLSAKSPQLQITPAPLPAGVSVSPAQGFVNVSNNDQDYPKGVAAISITFGGREIAINEQCTTPAKIYVNDFTTPVAESMSRGVEIMTHKMATVLFKNRAYNNTGIYKIEVPEGFFYYDEPDTNAPEAQEDGDVDVNDQPVGTIDPSLYTPALTLYYEIYIGYAVSPTPGVVPELQNIVVTFPDADEITMNGGDPIEFFKTNGSNYNITTTIMDHNGDGKVNDVVFSFGDDDGIAMEAFINPGEFNLMIPAGKFTYKTYGANYASDPTDFVERKSIYMYLQYEIPHFAQPAIIPDTEEPLESFTLFDIILPDNIVKMTNSDMVQNNIYSVSDNGVVNDGAPMMQAKINAANFYDAETDSYIYPEKEIILDLYDPETYEFIEEWTPASGRYCLRLGKSLFFGQYTDAFGKVEYINSPRFDYYYTIKNSIGGTGVENMENAEIADETVTVYTLSGIRVAVNEDPAVLGQLAPGLYIVNGKKMLKK